MPRPPTDLRDRILRAARAQFGSSGVDGASLRSIARAAGTSVGMISYHFESKDGLFQAMIDEFYDPVVADLEVIAASEADPLLRVQAILRRLVGVGEGERQTARILIREATVMSPRVPYVIGRFMAGHMRLLVQALSEARDLGQIRDFPPLGTVPIVLAPVMLPQLLRDFMQPVLGKDYDGIFERAIEILLYGLTPRD